MNPSVQEWNLYGPSLRVPELAKRLAQWFETLPILSNLHSPEKKCGWELDPWAEARRKEAPFSEMRWRSHDLRERGLTEASRRPRKGKERHGGNTATQPGSVRARRYSSTHRIPHTIRKRAHFPANLPTFLPLRPLKLLTVFLHVSGFQNSRTHESPPPVQSQSGSIASSPGARKRQR